MTPRTVWGGVYVTAGVAVVLFAVNAVVPFVATEKLVLGLLAAALTLGVLAYEVRHRHARDPQREARLHANLKDVRARRVEEAKRPGWTDERLHAAGRRRRALEARAREILGLIRRGDRE